jgi:threonylcarbamoyladenosine tRNA methylthiotransferase MtaB
LRAAFFTLGCKVNQYESAVMMQQFAAAGYDIAEPDEEADVYVVNSCTVTAAGDKKSRQALRRFRRQNPSAVLCLCGCFPQAFPEQAAAIAEADIIMGPKNRAGLLDAVQKIRMGETRIINIAPHAKNESFEGMRARDFHARTRAFVKIQDGCERFCAYCIIPKARGPVRSKKLEDLRLELEELAQAGYKEVVLAGINLSSYGVDTGLRLLDAVTAACGVGGIERVRLGSLEPELLTPGDIEAMSGLDKLCPQFHLSLQSGCDTVLRRMRRHYDTAAYAAIVDNLRRSFKNAAITTDIMVGFPGESEEEHRQSMEFVAGTGFARGHIFAFSPRPGTAAANMDGQIGNTVKARRSRDMAAVIDRSQKAFLQGQVGTTARVLFETREGGCWQGYSMNYTPVRVLCDGHIGGAIHDINLTAVEDDACSGWLAPGGPDDR